MTTCRSCQAEITWALTPNNRWMPIDAEPHPEGNVELHDGEPRLAVVLSGTSLAAARLEGRPLHRSHMATCPARVEHRKAG